MTYIPETLRRQVRARGADQCEYCLLPERYALKRHEVDHIRAEKHGGTTSSDNLCLSCYECNRNKGSDLSSVDPVSDDVVPLYHPRRDTWADHFSLEAAGLVRGKTARGRVTVLLLRMNDPDRILLRRLLIQARQLAIPQ